MSEQKSPSLDSEVLRTHLSQEQNAIEDELREDFLAQNLFHWGHVRGYDSINEMAEQLTRLKQEFLAEKRDANMGERFAMAISQKYLGKISVVELGLVESNDPQDYVNLKKQYNDLRNWLIMHAIISDEISREQSGRTLSYRQSRVDATRIVVIRQRPLIEAAMPARDDTGKEYGQTQFGIAKRQIFSAPRELAAIVRANASQSDDSVHTAMEEWERLLGETHPAIHRIRTGYYVISGVQETDEIETKGEL